MSSLSWRLIVFGKSFEHKWKNLSKVLEKLKVPVVCMKPKAKKCTFFAKEVEHLRHVISSRGVSTDPKKVKSIRDWHVPTTAKEVRSFLGVCEYYWRFIEKYAKEAKQLTHLIETEQDFIWTNDCQNAFENLKNCMIKAPLLVYQDFSRFYSDKPGYRCQLWCIWSCFISKK